MPVTEPLRAEHAELRPHLAELATLAADVGTWSDGTPSRLVALVGFLREHLVPHARAEEAALYPAVEQAMGAPGATDTMKADHVDIVARIDRVADLVAGIGERAPAADRREQLRAELYGLDAVLALHFAKEEDVLLPVLDDRLSAAEADALFAAMAAAAHPRHSHAQ
jgi:iron-sulfur cluster repair protein YtfE (RIC family)